MGGAAVSDLAALLLCTVVGTVVLSVFICGICAIKALQFMAEERAARRRDRRRERALSPHVPLQPMREDPIGDVLWEYETDLDRARARREDRDSEHSGC